MPISLHAFGEEGLALAVAFFLVLSVGYFTLGMVLSGAEHSFRRLLVNPIIVGLGLVLPILLLDLECRSGRAIPCNCSVAWPSR
ncbi:hypothetical protein [Azotobacter armeniacus]